MEDKFELYDESLYSLSDIPYYVTYFIKGFEKKTDDPQIRI